MSNENDYGNPLNTPNTPRQSSKENLVVETLCKNNSYDAKVTQVNSKVDLVELQFIGPMTISNLNEFCRAVVGKYEDSDKQFYISFEVVKHSIPSIPELKAQVDDTESDFSHFIDILGKKSKNLILVESGGLGNVVNFVVGLIVGFSHVPLTQHKGIRRIEVLDFVKKRTSSEG